MKLYEVLFCALIVTLSQRPQISKVIGMWLALLPPSLLIGAVVISYLEEQGVMCSGCELGPVHPWRSSTVRYPWQFSCAALQTETPLFLFIFFLASFSWWIKKEKELRCAVLVFHISWLYICQDALTSSSLTLHRLECNHVQKSLY